MASVSLMHEREASARLLPGVVAGDAASWEALLRLWSPAVLAWCARLGGPGVDAEDATHDVLEHVLAKVHTLRDPSAFPPWIYAATRRVVLDHRRRAWLRRWVPGLAPDVPHPTAHQIAEDDDLARVVRRAIDALPADLREVIVLVEMEERPTQEVAELLDVPLGTVKSRLRRARARFEFEARRCGLRPDPEGR